MLVWYYYLNCLGEAGSVILAIISILFLVFGELPFLELSYEELTCLSLNFTLDLLILMCGCSMGTPEFWIITGGGLLIIVFPLTIFKFGITFSEFELLTAVAADAVPLFILITD